jgi:hypothetical protein
MTTSVTRFSICLFSEARYNSSRGGRSGSRDQLPAVLTGGISIFSTL